MKAFFNASETYYPVVLDTLSACPPECLYEPFNPMASKHYIRKSLTRKSQRICRDCKYLCNKFCSNCSKRRYPELQG